MRMAWIAVLLAASVMSPAGAAEPSRPVVVELFTSESCSSCPPADALLTELAQTRPDLLGLAFHVTYWNGLGWRDPYSLPAATERQRDYARRRAGGDVFTPELVVEGVESVVGSDRAAVEAALRRAIAGRTSACTLDVSREGALIRVEVGRGAGSATVLLIGFDVQHKTPIGRGENSGRTLVESNIVRSLASLGRWSGDPLVLRAPVPPGERVSVILQADDGRIFGAARLVP